MILFLQLTEEFSVLYVGNIDRLAIYNKVGGEWDGFGAINGAGKRNDEECDNKESRQKELSAAAEKENVPDEMAKKMQGHCRE
jgi:hypothetical protein